MTPSDARISEYTWLVARPLPTSANDSFWTAVRASVWARSRPPPESSSRGAADRLVAVEVDLAAVELEVLVEVVDQPFDGAVEVLGVLVDVDAGQRAQRREEVAVGQVAVADVDGVGGDADRRLAAVVAGEGEARRRVHGLGLELPVLAELDGLAEARRRDADLALLGRGPGGPAVLGHLARDDQDHPHEQHRTDDQRQVSPQDTRHATGPIALRRFLPPSGSDTST